MNIAKYNTHIQSRKETVQNITTAVKRTEVYQKAHKDFYNSRIWKSLRHEVLTSNPTCYRCSLANRVTAATAVDHMLLFKDKYDPLSTRVDNLFSLCHSCHALITIHERYNNWNALYIYKGSSLSDIQQLKYKRGLDPLTNGKILDPV